MNNLRQLCKCGHHKDTHYDKEYACLGACCECKRYRNEDEPNEPLPTSRMRWAPVIIHDPNRPHINKSCRCQLCRDYDQWDFGA